MIGQAQMLGVVSLHCWSTPPLPTLHAPPPLWGPFHHPSHQALQAVMDQAAANTAVLVEAIEVG